MKCWKCGNELITGDKPNSLMCRTCEEKQNISSFTTTDTLFSSEFCSECGWTNVGLINLGEPEKPRMVCMGCCKRAIEKLDACRSILPPTVIHT